MTAWPGVRMLMMKSGSMKLLCDATFWIPVR